jgi:hypothetical protein
MWATGKVGTRCELISAWLGMLLRRWSGGAWRSDITRTKNFPLSRIRGG